MARSEMIFLGGLALFAAVLLIGSTGMPFTSSQTFGPGFVPLVMSVAILATIGLVVFRALRGGGDDGRAIREPEPAAKADAGAEPGGGIASVGGAVALIAAAILAARFGSLLLPLGLCILIVTVGLLGRDWRVGAVSTLATIAVIYGIFNLWLQIPIT